MQTRQLVEFGILIMLLVDLVGVPVSFEVSGAGIEATQPSSSAPNGRCQWSSATSRIITCAVYPTDDSFVDNMFPSEAMQVYSYWDVSGQIPPVNRVIVVQDTVGVPASKNYGFLRFDFSKVLPSAIIEAHAKPLNASLWLYSLYTVGFQNASVRAYNVPNSNWTEDALTWNNMPKSTKVASLHSESR